uniref:uncharacterized protein n=1 Tax=Pristiophorus japonicus TaxID=55135 RepID=UPI00398F6619
MWILILLMCSLPVSGALWANNSARGIVGRAITIECHYDQRYRSHVKYWCHGRTRLCSVVVTTDDQHGWGGRVSITDNQTAGIFVVTMKDLRSADAGWYSCGITQSGINTMFPVELQISHESVSVPVLRYLSPPNVSCFGGSVSVSCESVQGSLPIQYTWYEQTPIKGSKISDTNKLDLHCQSFKQQHHQYYCTASNNQGEKSSEMVDVSVFNRAGKHCSYVTQISDSVSGALWASNLVRGIVGRAITIECHYGQSYWSFEKYWCQGWTPICSVVVTTNDQHGWGGRVSITDNQRAGIFVVTMKDLRSADAGWYSCGITESGGFDTRFNIELQISHESVSVPVLRYLSPPNVSCSGGSVSASCESVQGSLPIQYTWYEQTPIKGSKISDTNKLDLHCQSFKQQHHQYYCTASNNQGEKSSEMVDVSVFNRAGKHCSYVTQISGIVSGALWANKRVRGIVGRAITIECHYDQRYRSHVKYWCQGWTHQCSVVVTTNDQHGWGRRVSITDNQTAGIFVVTMKDLRSADAGWYSCGITESGSFDKRFNIELQISHESVSVPVLRYLSPPNVSCSGGSVSASCESVQGSLPIQYTWYEQTPIKGSKISDTNKLDLHCQSFKQQHHQYYCTASNNQGEKSSEMVDVSVFNRAGKRCSYVTQISGIGLEYSCEVFSTVSPTTAHSTSTNVISTDNQKQSSGSKSTKSYITWNVGRWLLFALLVICTISVTRCTRKSKLLNESARHSLTNVVNADLNFAKKTMWILILLMCSRPVSGALWANKRVRGIVGRAITIECHYDQRYRSHVKYWCQGWTHQCSVVVTTNDQHGWGRRVSITDNQTAGIFVVTMKDLRSADAGWYSCGITESGSFDKRFNIELQISHVSGALWANKRVRGIVGRAITIECHYDQRYRSHVKYWCQGWTHQCSVVVTTNDQHGWGRRVSITDNQTAGIFVVTMKDLRSADAGWYSCGITESGSFDKRFNIELQISHESVSVPVLRYFSPPNVSCSGGLVSVFCESDQGSLPIQYTWYEQTPIKGSKISDTNKLDLHCQSFKQQHHQYYCTVSNNQGEESSEMVDVTVFNTAGKHCSYVTQISGIGLEYSCEVFSTVSPTTAHSTSTNVISTDNQKQSSGSKSTKRLIYIVLGVPGAFIVVLAVCRLLYLMQNKKDTNCIICHREDETLHDNQQFSAVEGSTVYASLKPLRRNSAEMPSEGTAQLSNAENGITFAAVQFQKKSTARSGEVARHSVNNKDSVTYSAIKVQTYPPTNNRDPPSPDTPQDSEMAIYANVRC